MKRGFYLVLVYLVLSLSLEASLVFSQENKNVLIDRCNGPVQISIDNIPGISSIRYSPLPTDTEINFENPDILKVYGEITQESLGTAEDLTYEKIPNENAILVHTTNNGDQVIYLSLDTTVACINIPNKPRSEKEVGERCDGGVGGCEIVGESCTIRGQSGTCDPTCFCVPQGPRIEEPTTSNFPRFRYPQVPIPYYDPNLNRNVDKSKCGNDKIDKEEGEQCDPTAPEAENRESCGGFKCSDGGIGPNNLDTLPLYEWCKCTTQPLSPEQIQQPQTSQAPILFPYLQKLWVSIKKILDDIIATLKKILSPPSKPLTPEPEQPVAPEQPEIPKIDFASCIRPDPTDPTQSKKIIKPFYIENNINNRQVFCLDDALQNFRYANSYPFVSCIDKNKLDELKGSKNPETSIYRIVNDDKCSLTSFTRSNNNGVNGLFDETNKIILEYSIDPNTGVAVTGGSIFPDSKEWNIGFAVIVKKK